jgi:hypothetical protein
MNSCTGSSDVATRARLAALLRRLPEAQNESVGLRPDRRIEHQYLQRVVVVGIGQDLELGLEHESSLLHFDLHRGEVDAAQVSVFFSPEPAAAALVRSRVPGGLQGAISAEAERRSPRPARSSDGR